MPAHHLIRIKHSAWCMTNLSFAFGKFHPSPTPEYFQFVVGWICRCKTLRYRSLTICVHSKSIWFEHHIHQLEIIYRLFLCFSMSCRWLTSNRRLSGSPQLQVNEFWNGGSVLCTCSEVSQKCCWSILTDLIVTATLWSR